MRASRTVTARFVSGVSVILRMLPAPSLSMPGNQAERKSRPRQTRPRQLLCPVVPALFSTGTRDANCILDDLPAAGPAACSAPRTAMSRHLDEEQQIKFSELSNIEHRGRNRKLILAL